MSVATALVGVDPVTRQVVQNRLISIVREMSHTLSRASFSPIITEVKDFSNVLLAPDGALVAQAEGIPTFLGAMAPLLPPVLDRYPLASVQPGDVFISNDPYSANGTHKNDVNVFRPVFDPAGPDAGPVFFAVSKAHWTDIGAKDPGSWSPDARNMFQEGVTIPPLRLVAAGDWNDELLEMILGNTRLREQNEGDLLAQIGALGVAESRVHDLLAEYGRAEVEAHVASLIDYAERATRAEVARIPDGRYRAEEWVDSDGVSEEPFRIVAVVEVDGDRMTVDLSESADQRAGACGNAVVTASVAAVRVAFKCLTLPHAATNEGSYRPLQVITRPGSSVHALAPAPVTLWGDVARAVIEAVLGAVGRADPSRAIGGLFGNVDAMALAGPGTGDGGEWIYFSPFAGGWGGRAGADGLSALCPIINGDNDNVPCEVIEASYPLRVERYELVPDSCGAGRRRGGLGVRFDVRILEAGATLSASLDRYVIAPPGVQGGDDGALSGLWVDEGDGVELPAHKVAARPLPAGALVSHRTGGGGGHGDPRRREPALVAADVADGYVTPEAAARLYGTGGTA